MRVVEKLIKTGYKVFKITPLRTSLVSKPVLVSTTSFYSYPRLFYKYNCKNYHKFGSGPIAVFDTYQNAYNFVISVNKTFVIYRIKYKESKMSDLFEFKSGIIYKIQRSYDNLKIHLPKGTKFATWIKIIKKCEKNRGVSPTMLIYENHYPVSTKYKTSKAMKFIKEFDFRK